MGLFLQRGWGEEGREGALDISIRIPRPHPTGPPPAVSIPSTGPCQCLLPMGPASLSPSGPGHSFCPSRGFYQIPGPLTRVGCQKVPEVAIGAGVYAPDLGEEDGAGIRARGVRARPPPGLIPSPPWASVSSPVFWVRQGLGEDYRK